MRKFFFGCVLILVVSFYLFPISFTFLPNAVNSKMLVAVFGILAFIFDSSRKGAMEFAEPTLGALLLAVVFSVWCLFSVTINDSTETTYATYFVSFATWMAGAYGVVAAIRLFYFDEEINLELITRYLAYVCVFQCIMAVLIDNNAGVAGFVDRIMDQGQDFYKKGHRLYGLGAALDPAGIRFSVVLTLMAHQIASNEEVRTRGWLLASYMFSFAVIMIIGSVISRTTMVGVILGSVYMALSLIRLRKGGFITFRLMRLFVLFFLFLGIIVGVTIFLYKSSETFEEYLRFGFEAFFNWVETGEFHTTSTDTLNNEMWVWPTEFRTWMIGRGTLGVFQNNTDIGYCNFILYCGLIGLLFYSVYFVFCHLVLNRKFKNFWIPSLLLVAMTFIFWIKVSTDIFFIDALLFCIPADV